MKDNRPKVQKRVEDLLQAVAASDVALAGEIFDELIAAGRNAWDVHLSLYRVVQGVLNPPFINPHLPKMYRINRELASLLGPEELPSLVRLEVTEYARRPKLEEAARGALPRGDFSFVDIESAVGRGDREGATLLMAAFAAREGAAELARRLLVLGSGYLDQTLGHSISCTVFMLLEMIDRPEEDSRPVLTALADYFCKGHFDTTPALRATRMIPEEEYSRHLLRAASGRGIVNLHHTITFYAIEQARPLVSDNEYHHMVQAGIEFMGEKDEEPVKADDLESKDCKDYMAFFEQYSKLEIGPVANCLAGMTTSTQRLPVLGRFLVRCLCDLYHGEYNPHNLTGLGSALWFANRYRNYSGLAVNALYQYVDYFFAEIEKTRWGAAARG
jgi:hypothetical protein